MSYNNGYINNNATFYGDSYNGFSGYVMGNLYFYDSAYNAGKGGNIVAYNPVNIFQTILMGYANHYTRNNCSGVSLQLEDVR